VSQNGRQYRSHPVYSHDWSAILLYCVCGPIMGIYKSLTDTIHECRNWEQGRAVSFLGIFVLRFQYSVDKKEGARCKGKDKKNMDKSQKFRKGRDVEGGRWVKEDENRVRKRGSKERK
jgi:hypothetical protein